MKKNYNNEVATNANTPIFKVTVISIIKKTIDGIDGRTIDGSSNLTYIPRNRANQFKDMWLVNMSLNGFDTTNPKVTENDDYMIVNIQDASLTISWEELDEVEYDMIEGYNQQNL